MSYYVRRGYARASAPVMMRYSSILMTLTIFLYPVRS